MPTTKHSPQDEPRTVTAKVYKSIKHDILNGVFPPGAHLVRRTLAKQYGVSPLPIMEACFRLERDGLVENSPMYGTHVVEMDEAMIEEERKLREALDCQVARFFSEFANDFEKQQVKILAEQVDAAQAKLATGGREQERAFLRCHADFHLAVSKYARSSLIHQQLEKLWRRQMIADDIIGANSKMPPYWHAILAEELMGSDPDRAECFMREHLKITSDKEQDSTGRRPRPGNAEFMARLRWLHEDEEMPY